MTRAAIYARKSTDDSDRNAEARSTQRQIDSATAYAATKGWTVDPRYIFVDENTSGAEWKQRPGFNALLAALDPRPPFRVVIVSELSRIGRDTVRTPAAVMRIEEAGVEIRSYLSDAPISLADAHFSEIVESCGLRLNKKKTLPVAGPNEKHQALGVVMNSSDREIDAPRAYRAAELGAGPRGP
jgi:resolvase-like protein